MRSRRRPAAQRRSRPVLRRRRRRGDGSSGDRRPPSVGRRRLTGASTTAAKRGVERDGASSAAGSSSLGRPLASMLRSGSCGGFRAVAASSGCSAVPSVCPVAARPALGRCAVSICPAAAGAGRALRRAMRRCAGRRAVCVRADWCRVGAVALPCRQQDRKRRVVGPWPRHALALARAGMLGLQNACLGRHMRHGAPLDADWREQPVQSPGHARNFEKLPKFQRLVLSGCGPVGAADRHDLLAGGKNCRRRPSTMPMRRAGIPIIRVPQCDGPPGRRL